MSVRSTCVILALTVVGGLVTTSAITQTPYDEVNRERIRRQSGLRGQVLSERINEQKVNRQTEILRLETMIQRLETRITRLERFQMSSTQLPLVSIEEAEATVKFAEVALEESTREAGDGPAADSRVAADELALARARGQLKLAKAAAKERCTLLEADVTFAQRRLLEATSELKLRERLVARGYAQSDELQRYLLDVEQAKQQVEIARIRLSAASGETDPPR